MIRKGSQDEDGLHARSAAVNSLINLALNMTIVLLVAIANHNYMDNKEKLGEMIKLLILGGHIREDEATELMKIGAERLLNYPKELVFNPKYKIEDNLYKQATIS